MLITSLQNPRIKDLAKLKNRRARDERKVMLIEGYKPILIALDNNVSLTEIYHCPDLYLGANEAALVARAASQGAAVYETTAAIFQKIAYRDRPEGLIAVAPQFKRALLDLPVSDHALFLVAQAIEKPGNLGTMLRTADAAGATGVIVCDPITDMFNPNVIRASLGTLFTVPVARADTESFFNWKSEHGISLIAATPSASTVFTEVDLTGRVALAVGTEQVGLPKDWIDRADQPVLIPMYGQADSLNAAAAGTLILYEAVRQRRAAGLLT